MASRVLFGAHWGGHSRTAKRLYSRGFHAKIAIRTTLNPGSPDLTTRRRMPNRVNARPDNEHTSNTLAANPLARLRNGIKLSLNDPAMGPQTRRRRRRFIWNKGGDKGTNNSNRRSAPRPRLHLRHRAATTAAVVAINRMARPISTS